jgi:quercetin dioxygenase-like cupin family protein
MPRTAIAVPLLVGAVLAATVAPATARTDAVALGSSTVDLTAYGTAFGGYSFPMAAGRKVSVRHYTMAPSQIIDWGKTPETVIGVVFDGDGVTNYLGCKQKQPWKVGHGFYFIRSKAAGTLDGVTVNESKDEAEVYALVSETPGQPQAQSDLHTDNGVPENPPVPAGGCPTGEAATMEELGSAVATGTGSFRTDDHEGIAVYTVKAAPGYSSGWHYLADPGFLIQTKGNVEVWSNCGTKRTQEAGKAYVNDSMERSQRISNSGTSPAEFLVITFNQADFYPPDLGPMTPEFPPSDCVDTGIPR